MCGGRGCVYFWRCTLDEELLRRCGGLPLTNAGFPFPFFFLFFSFLGKLRARTHLATRKSTGLFCRRIFMFSFCVIVCVACACRSRPLMCRESLHGLVHVVSCTSPTHLICRESALFTFGHTLSSVGVLGACRCCFV